MGGGHGRWQRVALKGLRTFCPGAVVAKGWGFGTSWDGWSREARGMWAFWAVVGTGLFSEVAGEDGGQRASSRLVYLQSLGPSGFRSWHLDGGRCGTACSGCGPAHSSTACGQGSQHDGPSGRLVGRLCRAGGLPLQPGFGLVRRFSWTQPPAALNYRSSLLTAALVQPHRLSRDHQGVLWKRGHPYPSLFWSGWSRARGGQGHYLNPLSAAPA